MKIKGSLYTIISAVLFGLMPLITKTAYKFGTNAYMVVLGRFFFGTLLLGVMCLICKKSIKIEKKQIKNILILSIPYCFTPVILYASYNYIDSGLATTLHFCYPVLVVLLSLVFYKKKLTTKQIICELLCVIGITILSNTYGFQNLKGMIIAIVSGLVYASYIVLLENKKVDGVETMALSFWIALISFLIMLIVTIISDKFIITGQVSVGVCYFMLGLFATAIGLRLFQLGVLLIGSIKASILSMFEPITGIVIGILMFNERIGIKEATAIILIMMAACLIVTPSKIKEK